MEVVAAAVHVVTQADAPQRGGSPLRRRRPGFAHAVVEARTHVVEEQVGVRVDGALGVGGDRGRPGRLRRAVAGGAPGRREDLRTPPFLRLARGRVLGAPRWPRCRGAGRRTADPTAPGRGPDVAEHPDGPVVARVGGLTGGDSHVDRQRRHGLGSNRGLRGLPSEAASGHPARDAVVVGVIGIRRRVEVRPRNGFEQAETEQGGAIRSEIAGAADPPPGSSVTRPSGRRSW